MCGGEIFGRLDTYGGVTPQPSLSEPLPMPHVAPDAEDAGRIASLVRAHRLRLARIAAYEGVCADEAFDCVQDALCSFLTMSGSSSLDEEAASRVLSAMVRNLARNQRRAHAVCRPHARDEETLAALVSPAPDAEELLDQAAHQARLIGCVGRLRSMQQAVVTLRLLEDRPGESVAVALGLTPQSVAVHLHRAKHLLRRCMVEDESD